MFKIILVLLSDTSAEKYNSVLLFFENATRGK